MIIGSMIENFIISPLNGEKYNNTKQVGDKTLIINTSIENSKDVNRYALVKSLPIKYSGNVKVGDIIIVQHNVFRDRYDSAGHFRTSDWHIKDDLFFVEPELAYLIIRNDEKICIDNFCFIKPIFIEDRFLGNVEQKHQGIVKYGNDSLKKEGINDGDHIGFHNNCEVPFVIDGELLYKMKTHRVLAKLN